MNRNGRWLALLLFGTAIFELDAAVRAASPADASCMRTGTIGMLRAGVVPQLATRSTTASENHYRQEIERAQKIAPRIYDEGLHPGAATQLIEKVFVGSAAAKK